LQYGALSDTYAAALEMSRGLVASPRHIAQVARAVGDDAARWAFSQWDLRERAAAKFARASEMLFTREALEQATHEQISHYHASQFPSGALVADLTCGIGADLIAIAARGQACAYEVDLQRASYAKHNLRVHDVEATIRIGDCLASEWDFEFAFADPARRTNGRRTLRTDEFSPNPEALFSRMKSLRLGGVKLSPLLQDSFLEQPGGRLVFVSYGGECREAVLWLGDVDSGRFAHQIESGESLPAGGFAPTTEEPYEYLYEADAAAVRAHCLPALCSAFGLSLLGDSNGYLTGKGVQETAWLKRYRVLATGNLDERRVRNALISLDSATPPIKSRSPRFDGASFQKRLRLTGRRRLTLAVFPVGLSNRFAVLDPSPTGAI
jgi:hypothetical protein